MQKMTVVDVCPLTQDIIQIVLKPTDEFNYDAGDYVMLGFDEGDLKPFSIAAAPKESGLLEFHVRKQPDSDWMEALFEIKAYDTLMVDGPKPQYKVADDKNASILLVAGGTGFAPMKALLDELLRSGKDDIIEFYWGARKEEDLYLHHEMVAMCKLHTNLNYIPVVSEDDFSGRKGLVHQAVLQDHPNLESFRVYLCGPWPMQEAAKADFLEAGLPEAAFN